MHVVSPCLCGFYRFLHVYVCNDVFAFCSLCELYRMSFHLCFQNCPKRHIYGYSTYAHTHTHAHSLQGEIRDIVREAMEVERKEAWERQPELFKHCNCSQPTWVPKFSTKACNFRHYGQLKAEMGKVRGKKIQVGEKVGKSRNITFFQRLVAQEGRKVGSLQRRVQGHLER